MNTEDIKNMSKSMPLWHANYFELKIVKAQKTQKEL